MKQRGHIERHIIVHTKDKPYSCPYCMKRFTQKYDVQRHVMIHTGEKPFACNYCNQSFTRKSTLDMHIINHNKNQCLIEILRNKSINYKK